MAHKAKRIDTGEYVYRGFAIVKVDNWDNFKQEFIGHMWHITEDYEVRDRTPEHGGGSFISLGAVSDAACQLQDAKYVIDTIIAHR